MRLKTISGWIVLLLISFTPALIWYFLRPVQRDLTQYAEITHALGQITALVGMTMFALTFVLSTRLKFIEELFGGLDKVYQVHGFLGGASLILLVFHPILLVMKYVPLNPSTAVSYLLPGHSLSVDFGIIALLGMLILLFATFYVKIKYQYWKMSHKFLGLFFIIAALHVFLVRGVASRDDIFAGYYLYAAIVSVIGITAFIYSLLLKTRMSSAIYKVESINRKDGVIHDITLAPVYKALNYKSGQFVFLKFYNDKLGKEAHPFSIASKSNDPKIRVVIKSLGDYTSSLVELRKGDRALIEGPYGRFNHKRTNLDKVWIAGGIGITPFIGMAQDFKDAKRKDCKVHLYYAVRKEKELVSFETFKDVENSCKSFKIFPWVSEKDGYLTAEEIKKRSGGFIGKEFYLCGPKELKDSITRVLVKEGVSKDNIFQEEFSFK